MSEKYWSKLSVNLLLTRENNGKKEVMLQLRQNTGYMDGMYDFVCGGHVEKGESYAQAIIRESKEEIGIIIEKDDLEFKSLCHHFNADYVQVVFSCKKYKNNPKICEPDLCKELLWVDINNLPENTVPYVKQIIKNIENGIKYSEDMF